MSPPISDSARRSGTVTYRRPPADVAAVIDAPLTPLVVVSPDGRHWIEASYDAVPSITDLAAPQLKLAGLRFDPRTHDWHRTWRFTAFRVHPSGVEAGASGAEAFDLDLPEGGRLGRPIWSPAGARFAFTRTVDAGVELWLANVESRAVLRLVPAVLNETLGSCVTWTCRGDAILARLRVPGRETPPPAPEVPAGPVVEDTSGRAATNRTYQDLLRDARDEALFEHHCTAQLAFVDPGDGTLTRVGAPGIFLDASPSPDGRHLLIERVRRPYSHAVPVQRFARVAEVWSRGGAVERLLCDLDAAEEVPIQGVVTGPRAIAWQALEPATLVWLEALDGGDPRRETPWRDVVLRLDAPFSGAPAEFARTAQRCVGLDWLERRGAFLITEWDRDRRWITTRYGAVGSGGTGRVLFDRSLNDRYGDPGQPVLRRAQDGSIVVRMDGNAIFLRGDGATAEGDRPFLDRFDVDTGTSARVFASDAGEHASFLQFLRPASDGSSRFLIRVQTRSSPPDDHLVERGARRRLTRRPDPHPWFTGVEKRLLRHRRADGVELSGTLYVPKGTPPGTALPLVVHAYPQEFNDAATAGQVDAQPQAFVRLAGTSPLFFLTQGYAVLDDATMPIVGDAETANDTFVEQVVASATAAIDAAAAQECVDRARCAVIGHSYGALMAATLLAHSDLFRAGIARSGAYNRTLTPFGFQNERRTLWQAPGVYLRVSPFLAADRIRRPLLLIHGQDDENPGTFPLQSERLFHALSGLGGTSRLVLLPREGHGYAARESILHVLAESFEWFDRHVKQFDAPSPAGADPESR